VWAILYMTLRGSLADMEDPHQSDKGVGKCVRVRVRGADSQGTVFTELRLQL
jgi:hypothetical protein